MVNFFIYFLYFDTCYINVCVKARVFNDLGKGVLDNAWKGFNCSLFAYGQTGSGKSYSMVGNKENKGEVIAKVNVNSTTFEHSPTKRNVR